MINLVMVDSLYFDLNITTKNANLIGGEINRVGVPVYKVKLVQLSLPRSTSP